MARQGFSLVETLVAMTILALALLSLAMLFPLEARLGALSQTIGQTGVMAQKELDQIRANAFSSSGTFIDADGNTNEVACTGSPGTSCGNPLTSSGAIDFSSAAPVGFSAQIADSSGQRYSVRWNITVTSSYGSRITLASQAIDPPSGLAPVVQFQTIVVQ